MNMENLKLTTFINALSFFKLPLLAFATPRVVELTDSKSVVKIPLGYRTRNHLGVMYFGALAMGAELSIALKCVTEIQKSKKRIDFLFKDFQCEFLKRGDGDVYFVCDQAGGVAALVHEAITNPERLEKTFEGYAYVPSKSEEPVMKYRLTLTMKNRSLKT